MRVHLCLPLLAAASFAMPIAATAAEPTSMRIAGNFSSNTKHIDQIERPFFTNLPKILGTPMTINYNAMDTVGVQAADALRMLRSGTFDVMSVQIGMAHATTLLRGHRPDRRVDQPGRTAQGRRRLPPGVRRAPAEALQRQGDDAVAVRAAGLLLQQADQDARRRQGPEGAQLHARRWRH
jgi:hypothetical protein